MDPLTRYPCRRADLAYRMVGGEAVVVAPAVSQVHELNPTASFIWERCTGNIPGSEVLEALLTEFEVDPKAAHKDVRSILLQFHELKLIDLNPRPQVSERQGRSAVSTQGQDPQGQEPQNPRSPGNLGSHQSSPDRDPQTQEPQSLGSPQVSQTQVSQIQDPQAQAPHSLGSPRVSQTQSSQTQSSQIQSSQIQNSQSQSSKGQSLQSSQSQNAQTAGKHPAKRPAATTEGVES